MPSIMQGSLDIYPHLKQDCTQGPSKSLNIGSRMTTERRIMEENERMLNRLQDQNSHYNVYDWELDRKQSIKRVKAICYYPPTMIRKKGRSRGGKRSKTARMFTSEPEEPNRKIFDAYQESMRKSSDMGEPADSAEFS